MEKARTKTEAILVIALLCFSIFATSVAYTLPTAQATPTQGEIDTALSAAKTYIDRLYWEEGDYAYMKEFLAPPLRIYVNGKGWILAGWKTKTENYVDITIEEITLTSERFLYGFEDMCKDWGENPDFDRNDLVIRAKFTYMAGGVDCDFDVVSTTSSRIIDFYLGPNLMFVDATHKVGWHKDYFVSTANYNQLQSWRWTARHGNQLGSKIYNTYGYNEMNKTFRLRHTLYRYSFDEDIYDPVMGYEYLWLHSDDFCADECWWDLQDNVWNNMAGNKSSRQYPYKSAIFTFGLDNWFQAYLEDPSFWVQLGVHKFLRYKDAAYLDTMLQNAAWDGKGVKGGPQGLLSPAYSTMRTALYLIGACYLSRIGYHGHIDWSTWQRADEVASVLLGVQWQGEGWAKIGDEYKYISRWLQQGGFMTSYVRSETAWAAYRSQLLEWAEDLILLLGGQASQDAEYKGMITCSQESTLSAMRALLLYKLFRYSSKTEETSYPITVRAQTADIYTLQPKTVFHRGEGVAVLVRISYPWPYKNSSYLKWYPSYATGKPAAQPISYMKFVEHFDPTNVMMFLSFEDSRSNPIPVWGTRESMAGYFLPSDAKIGTWEVYVFVWNGWPSQPGWVTYAKRTSLHYEVKP